MLGKKSYTRKNSITRGLGKKTITQTKSPIPPLKSEMVGP